MNFVTYTSRQLIVLAAFNNLPAVRSPKVERTLCPAARALLREIDRRNLRA